AFLGVMLALVLGVGITRLISSRGGKKPDPPLSLDPRLKLGCALALPAAVVALPASDVGRVVAVCAVAGLWSIVGRVPLRWLVTRLALLAPFVALLALSAGCGGEPLGSARAAALMLKAWAALLAMGVFVATTPETEALATLRWYRVPTVVVQLVAFALRYLRVLGEEAERMLRARAARSGAGSGALLSYRLHVTGAMIGSLFVRSYEHGERVALAMQARGYLGPGWLPYRRSLSALDYLAALAFAILLGLACYLR
ncbi:MAG: hypothetical protein HY320_15730, partial [Armatimonadetes bacterium]|nr:hypothetical protein [Armatimonadota bacterium]